MLNSLILFLFLITLWKTTINLPAITFNICNKIQCNFFSNIMQENMKLFRTSLSVKPKLIL